MSDLPKAYTILGLEPGCSKDEIQKRYKRLAVAWHPDRFPTADAKADAEAELKKILGAKDLLMKHFDSGKHKGDACECTGKKPAAPPAADTTPVNTNAASAKPANPVKDKGKAPPRQSAAQNRAGAAGSAMDDDAVQGRPNEEQLRRWDRLEREMEREERQKEDAEARDLVLKYFEQQRQPVEKPKLKTVQPRRKKVRTIEDELRGVSAGKPEQYGWPEKTAEFMLFQYDEAKLILLSPVQYFESMELTGGYKQPVIFASIIAAINSVIVLATNIQHPLGAVVTLVGIIGFSFAQAALTFFLSRPLGGTGDFEATYRACVACMTPYLVLWLPIVNVFAVIYSFLLLKLALEPAQELSPTRSTTVVALQVLGMAIIGGILVLMGLATLINGHNH